MAGVDDGAVLSFVSPAAAVRTVLLALIGFMPSPGMGAIGALDYPAEERRALAEKSLRYDHASHAAPNTHTNTHTNALTIKQ